MPKMKSVRGAAKRFRKTGGNKFLYAKAGKRHILTKKGRGRKRKLRKSGMVGPSDIKAVRRMLPY